MKDKIKNIKDILKKYKLTAIVILTVISVTFFSEYKSKNEKFDPSKFKNLAKYGEQLVDDAEENQDFSQGEINNIDFSSRRDTNLLDTEGIVPESNLERALLIAMQEGKKLNEEHSVLENKLVELQKDIYPDEFILPKNLHTLDRLYNSKEKLQILQSSTIEYGDQYQKLTKRYEKSISDKINDPSYSDSILNGYKKSLAVNMSVQKALISHFEVTERVLDFCIQAVSNGQIEYYPDEDNIAFTNDELVEKYNKLIKVYNATVVANDDARNKQVEHYRELQKKSAEVFK